MSSTINYEGIIIENQNLKNDLTNRKVFPENHLKSIKHSPADVVTDVPLKTYLEYRRGHDSACADIILATRLPDNTPAVLLSKRKKNVCYGGLWWIYGGAIHSYIPLLTFIANRVEKECGVRVEPQALVGVYRTMAEDLIGSTLQVCFAAIIPYEKIQHNQTDENHDFVRLFPLNALENIPQNEQHWYPMRVVKKVLKAMRS